MRKFLNIAGQSLEAVRAFKMRTLFCLVSVALGIASLTIIVAATEGAYKKAYDIVERFGPDSLLVAGGSEEARATGQRDKTITLDDVAAIKEAFPEAYLVVPMTSVGDLTFAYRNQKYQSRVIGSSDDYSSVWSWPVVQGSDISEEDVKGFRNVALIGSYLADTLFGKEDPVGKYILVKNIPIQVIGVLLSRGTSPSGANLDDRLIMPITTVMKKMQNETKYVNTVRIRFVDQNRINEYEQEVRSFLRQRHNIPQGEPDDFRVVSPKEITKFLVALTGSLVVFLGVVGVISLLVAGFVLANLFLLSVKERAKEIGIRRSVGARKRDILMQFMGESVIITSLGGVTGFMLGFLSSHLLTRIAQFPIYFSWKAFAFGLILSWFIGIVFGMQPASRAANLEPIEALRG
jgi:putative ABC transport system permease protein